MMSPDSSFTPIRADSELSLSLLRQSFLMTFISEKPRSASVDEDGKVRQRSTRARMFGHDDLKAELT